MNEEIQQLIDNINAVITTNGNEEITGDILNSILNEMVSVLYGITGDPQYLNTFAKDNLVDAINELDDLLGQINTIKLFSGTQDPNTFDVNGGEYEVRDFYMQTSNLGTIALWIYTGVIGVQWLNLTSKDSDVIFVVNRPTTGIQNKLYIQTSDNTMWRYVAGVGAWVQLGGSSEEVQAILYTPQDLTLEQQGIARDNIGVSSIFKQLFTYNSNANPTKSFQLNFIPTSVVYLTDTGSFLEGSDVGKTDYSIDTETAILTINVALKDSAEIIICYEHQNQTP